MARRAFVAGNWKMHKTIAEAEAFVSGLLPRVSAVQNVDIAICPPYLALQAVVDSVRGSQVAVYAQNMHDADFGAFTGEVCAPMLAEIDVDGVLLGHSERREFFGESDAALQSKVVKALSSDLAPMLCVGETEEERDRGDTERKLRHQVLEALEKVEGDGLKDVTIAYEPIWAIGTGQVATPEIAQEACAFVRALVEHFDKEAADVVRVLYGGSVKPDNAGELLDMPDIDGFLVGGASLEPDSFGAIIDAAEANGNP